MNMESDIMNGLGCDLPIEIVTEILSRLPVKTLLRFKCVCREWFNIINSRQFVKLHLECSLERSSGFTVILYDRSHLRSLDLRHPQVPSTELHSLPCIKYRDKIRKEYHRLFDYFNYPIVSFPPRMIGSCNGIVCISRDFDGDLLLYNPATRVCKQVSYEQVPRLETEFDRYRNYFGYGYDCIGDDYKILWYITYLDNNRRKIGEETFIYSLQADSWEKIQNPPWGLPDYGINWVFADNSLYCVATRNDKSVLIMRFNLSTYKYDEVSLPVEIDQCTRLAVLKGHLVIVTNDLDIWTLKESWTRLFRCSSAESSKLKTRFPPLPFTCSKCGCRLILGELDREHSESLICYDLDSDSTSNIQVLGLPDYSDFSAHPWVESLVPLL